jgi:hypothetical protein
MMMNTSPALPRPRVAVTVIAAALSLLIATVLFVAIAELFVRDGLPLQNAAMAERACSGYAFVSERETCVQAIVAASYHRHVASR